MREVDNLKRISDLYSNQSSGTLSIATTHTQARYVLPIPVSKLRENYPNVSISLHQGAPSQVAQMLLDEIAELLLCDRVTEWAFHAALSPHKRGSGFLAEVGI